MNSQNNSKQMPSNKSAVANKFKGHSVAAETLPTQVAQRMPRPGAWLAVFALGAVLLSLAYGLVPPSEGQTLATAPGAWRHGWGLVALLAMGLAGVLGLQIPGRWPTIALSVAALVAGVCWAQLPPAQGEAEGAAGFWLPVLSLAALAVLSIQRLALLEGRSVDRWLAAAVFGLWVLVFWQVLTLGLGVPRVLLPAPSFIGAALMEHADKLGGDFVQTVLKAVAACTRSRLRGSDVLGRLGGEEFGLVLPATGLNGARHLAEQVRQAVEALELQGDGGQPLRVTLSAGVAEAARADTPETLMHLADSLVGLERIEDALDLTRRWVARAPSGTAYALAAAAARAACPCRSLTDLKPSRST